MKFVHKETAALLEWMHATNSNATLEGSTATECHHVLGITSSSWSAHFLCSGVRTSQWNTRTIYRLSPQNNSKFSRGWKRIVPARIFENPVNVIYASMQVNTLVVVTPLKYFTLSLNVDHWRSSQSLLSKSWFQRVHPWSNKCKDEASWFGWGGSCPSGGPLCRHTIMNSAEQHGKLMRHRP